MHSTAFRWRGVPDHRILQDAAARAGVGLTSASIARFRSRYVNRLREALADPAHGGQVLPGVRPLLERLTALDDTHLALLTGNTEEGARLKLEHFDLWRFFSCGGFGDAAADRHHLFGAAMVRVRESGVPAPQPEDVVVVGDTELDVACAIAAGVRSLAVATGSSSVDALRQCGADAVFEDLADTDSVVAHIKYRDRCRKS